MKKRTNVDSFLIKKHLYMLDWSKRTLFAVWKITVSQIFPHNERTGWLDLPLLFRFCSLFKDSLIPSMTIVLFECPLLQNILISSKRSNGGFQVGFTRIPEHPSIKPLLMIVFIQLYTDSVYFLAVLNIFC